MSLEKPPIFGDFGEDPDEIKVVGSYSSKTNQRRPHHWKKGTIWVAGDRMVHGLIEPKLGKDGTFEVHSFPGATVDDMRDYFNLLSLKHPSEIFLHVATNDSVAGSTDVILH